MDNLQMPELNIVLPSLNGDQNKDLVSMDITESLKKDTVDTVLLQEEEELHIPCYLLDMTNVGAIMPATLQALQTMLESNGNTAVYIKNGNMTGLIGYGDAVDLYTKLETYINNVYSGKCVLYKNTGKGFSKVKPMDVDYIILDI